MTTLVQVNDYDRNESERHGLERGRRTKWLAAFSLRASGIHRFAFEDGEDLHRMYVLVDMRKPSCSLSDYFTYPLILRHTWDDSQTLRTLRLCCHGCVPLPHPSPNMSAHYSLPGTMGTSSSSDRSSRSFRISTVCHASARSLRSLQITIRFHYSEQRRIYYQPSRRLRYSEQK